MSNNTHLRVMVVDDDLRIHATIGTILQNAGLDFMSVLPVKLEEQLIGYRPNVIVLDLSMPLIDGIEALAILRAGQFGGRVVIITGGDPDLIETARRVGRSYGLKMAAGLSKPFRAGQLLAAIRSEEAVTPDADATSDVARGFANNEFTFYYQPKFDLRTRALTGFESLVRWRHPTQGLLLPGAFLTRVQSAGFKAELARIVLKDAVQRIESWHDEGLSTRLSINVGLADAVDPSFLLQLTGVVHGMSAPPSSLVIELLEASSDIDLNAAAAALARVRLLGVGISIDDFGMQSSSLARLQHLPANELKIDRSFVAALTKFKQDQIIVRSVIAMARELGLTAIAEGIEDQETLALLIELGCTQGQGFLLSEPLPAEDATRMLRGAAQAVRAAG